MSGFASFVSAGPGDPELLTLKTAARLRAAYVVLYDDLSSGAILDHARPGANLVAVGKRAGRPSVKQEHVNRLLIDYAAAGGGVVRLRSEDAGIFRRLEQEIEALRAAGISYEIIPRVTSACVAAARSNIPLTRRHTSRRLQLVTGADITGQLPENLNWAALAHKESTTLVYMGKRTFPALVARLIEHGMAPDTSSLFAESIGGAEQAACPYDDCEARRPSSRKPTPQRRSFVSARWRARLRDDAVARSREPLDASSSEGAHSAAKVLEAAQSAGA